MKKILLVALTLILVASLVIFSGCTPSTVTGAQGIQGEQGVQGAQGIQGIKGDIGNGISSVSYNNEDGKLTVYFTNGDTYTTSSIKGAKGDKGDTGTQGISITNVSYSSSTGKLTITLSNDTIYTTGDLRGRDGIDGLRGYTGAKGDKGDTGDDGKTYFENPFTGLAVCDSINGGSLGGSTISGYGVFTKIGAVTISGEVSEDWEFDSGYHYQFITGNIVLISIETGDIYTATIEGYQGYTTADDIIFAGTYTFTDGATGSGSITATITGETGISRVLHLSIYGTCYDLE